MFMQCAFAQVDTYPWSEGFESGSFEANGWSTTIVSGSVNWTVGTGAADGYLTDAYSGSYNAIISNSSYDTDTAVLLSPVFVRPSNMDTLQFSFYYANPLWSNDYDHLKVYLVDGENESELAYINEGHDSWTQMSYDLIVSDLPANFQIKFIGIPKYGYGFLIDDVVLSGNTAGTDPDPDPEVVIVDTYPWTEDFEIESLENNGWTTSILMGTASWSLRTGGADDCPLTTAHSGSKNAFINNYSSSGDQAALISPVFVRPGDIDTLEFSFYYANPNWSSDYDLMNVYLVGEDNETELAVINTSHNEWTRMRIRLVVATLPENFQIKFVGIPRYGYGLLLDDICLKEYEPLLPDVVDTDTYRQVGTRDLSEDLPVKTSYNYSYTQQIFTSNEMGGPKTIYSLSFDYKGNVSEEIHRNIKIYMKNTEKSSYSNDYYFVSAAEMTKVYSGVMTIPAEASWVTIDLETPFVYDGTSNLILAVLDITGEYTEARTFNCSELDEDMSLACYSSYSFPNVYQSYLSGTSSVKRNNVRFVFVEPEPVAPVVDVEETAEYLQVGTSATNGKNILPISTGYRWSFSQQIYDAREMGGERTIYSLSFNYLENTNGNVSRNIKVYLSHTDLSEYDNLNTDLVDWADMTKVYSGQIRFESESGWATIVLDNPFHYNGVDNLLVSAIDLTGTSLGSSIMFACSNVDGSCAVELSSYYSNDYDVIHNYIDRLLYFRSNIRFGLENIPNQYEADTIETAAYLQVGTSTANGKDILPINTDYRNSFSQQIYDAREMGGERTIYSLSFNYLQNTNGDVSRNVKVYLTHTALSEYDNTGRELVNWHDMTKVYSGRIRFEGESGWSTIVLDAPFHYNGVDNLIVTVVDLTGNDLGSAISFACSDANGSCAVNYSSYDIISYGDLLGVSFDLHYFRSNIRFGLEYIDPIQHDIDTIETPAYLQVGTGEQTVNKLPIQTDEQYSYSQQIYKAEEMGGQRTIYTISFNYVGNTSNGLTRNYKIYLGHTQLDEFDDEIISSDSLTKVFSGRASLDSENGWITAVLENPFVYNGTDNLIVAVYDITGSRASSVNFACSDVMGSCAFTDYGYYPISITNTSFSYYNSMRLLYKRNNIRFGLEYVEPPVHSVDTIETAEYLQVGTGTETNSYLPFNTNYPYNYSQQLFASYEMGGPRTIYTVSFNYTGNTNPEEIMRNTRLYMAHTDRYEFDYNLDWVKTTELVSLENVSINEETGWITYMLRRPFMYNGTDNLVVAVRDITGDNADGSIDFVCSETEFISAMRNSSYDPIAYNYDEIYGRFENFRRSNIRFGLEYVEPTTISVDTLETDSYLQVGTETTGRDALPIVTASKYSYSQQIFSADEIGEARTISSVSVNCVTNDNAEAVRNAKLYLGHTSKIIFESNDWVELSSLENVFDGNITIPPYSSWITIYFDEPFEYNGVDNLVVAWLDNTGTSHTEKRFVCTPAYNNGNSLIASSNLTSFDISNTTVISGILKDFRNNIRFGTESITVYNLEVSSNDEVMGSVSGSGRYEEGSVVDIKATAHPCFMFEKWSDGETVNPRQLTITEDVSLTAIFKSVDSDSLNYDNGVYNVSLGYRQQNVEWGILLLPQHLASRPKLADVMFFVDGEYSYGDYKLSVYQGTDTLPEEKILEDSLTVEQYTSGWLSFGFDTLDIDTEMPLWIILSCEGEYPAVASTFNGAGYENGSWWNPNGAWTQQTYGAWMIKAVLPLVEDESDDDDDDDDDDAVDMISAGNIGIYPNPVLSHLYINGVDNGETVEIYSIVGTMVASFVYNGDAVDVENLASGMYILRSMGRSIKFTKE